MEYINRIKEERSAYVQTVRYSTDSEFLIEQNPSRTERNHFQMQTRSACDYEKIAAAQGIRSSDSYCEWEKENYIRLIRSAVFMRFRHCVRKTHWNA